MKRKLLAVLMCLLVCGLMQLALVDTHFTVTAADDYYLSEPDDSDNADDSTIEDDGAIFNFNDQENTYEFNNDDEEESPDAAPYEENTDEEDMTEDPDLMAPDDM